MSPDRKPPPKRSKRRAMPVRARPGPNDAYKVVFFKRHKDDDQHHAEPGRSYLNTCPDKVRMTMRAVLSAVAAAPPHKFAGGGKWEAMHGDMSGYHEVRVDGPNRHHYRLFCYLDTEAVDDSGDAVGPYLVVLDGGDKPFRTVFPDSVYVNVKKLGNEYQNRNPRSLVTGTPPT